MQGRCRGPASWLPVVVLIVSLLALCGQAAAEPPALELPARGSVAELKTHSLVQFDPDRRLRPEALLQDVSGFKAFDPAMDRQAPPSWLLLNLKAAADSDGHYVLRVSRRFFTRFDLYAPGADGRILRRSAQALAAVDARTVGREFVFDLKLSPGETTPILLFVDLFQGSLQPLELSLQDAGSFAETRANTYLLFGLIFGILLALILHNFVLYLNLRQPGHLYYVLAMSSMLLLLGVDSGLLQNYLLPGFAQPWLARLNVLFAALMVLTIFLFFRAFVDAERLVPGIMRFGRWAIAVLLILAVAQWFAPPSLFPYLAVGSQLVNVLVFVLLLVAGFLAGRRGSVEGYIFLAAWSIFMISAFGRTLLSLDMAERNLVLEYLMYFGAVAEASILGLGLAYRVRQLYERHAIALREQNRAARLANLDPLTDAYNRRFLQTFLDNALNDARDGNFNRSVLILDLDHFKETNDQYGHAAGDGILRELVRRCQNHLGQGDVLCRLGGDEFVIVTSGEQSGNGLDLGRRIVQDFSDRPFEYEGQVMPVTVSVGVVSAVSPRTTVSDVLRMADQALYQAKRAGRNQAVLFDPDQATPFRHGPSMTPPREKET
ncbi:MAG: GGDEF domain-containing protein [Wenzhouxiangella sp.]|nr:MAG: GGDEF domain-containing protein [Wenzhouxiangella sp.]